MIVSINSKQCAFYQVKISKQDASNDAKIGKGMPTHMDLLDKFTDDLIREYGKYSTDSVSLHLSDIDKYTQLVYLNVYLTPAEFEEAIDCGLSREQLLSAESDNLQIQINKRLNEVFKEDMDDMERHFVMSYINGELESRETGKW